ncbi:NETI motif-containing protein [Bacillus sp. BGMRC 2118]|nr:NETI motif-containing protein [Bacillus sp. BGMRC 2118]
MPTNRPAKMKFYVEEHESIESCLDRMKKEGYTPVRRMEEPIFQEVVINGVKDVEPCGRTIVFEGKLIKDEH